MALYTPIATISYPNLFEPKMHSMAKPGDAARYGCTLLFMDPATMSPSDKALWETLVKAVMVCGANAFGGAEKFGEMLKSEPKKARLPFKSADTDKYGTTFKYQIDVWSTQPVGLVSRYAGRDRKPQAITNSREFYPGCLVKAEVNVYSYPKGNVPGIGKGINIGLQNVQKWDDGPRIDGRTDAADSFTADKQMEETDLASIGSAPPAGNGAAGPASHAATELPSGDSLTSLLG